MEFDESLYVTAKFTTARGLTLSKQSNALVIKDTSNNEPRTYDIYVDRNRGGPSTFRDGYYQKGPTSLYKVFREQYPNAIQRNGDTYNLHVAGNTAIVGSTVPANTYWEANEIRQAKVNLDVINYWPDIMNYNTPYEGALALDSLFSLVNYSTRFIGGLAFDSLYSLLWKHSEGDHRSRTVDEIIDLKGCYGKVKLLFWSIHHSSYNWRLIVYNANGTVASDVVYVANGEGIRIEYIQILKGQYARLIGSYVPGNIDTKNNIFGIVNISSYSAGLHTALLISGAYFNESHTINIHNDGLILGHGGDSINYTPQKGSGDWWNKEIVPVYTDTHNRIHTGGDAIVCTDVKQVNIYNNGTISGGGGASFYTHWWDGNYHRFTPGDGGAPYGRGGAQWSAFNANVSGAYIDPILHGKAATFNVPGSTDAGNWGRRGKNPEGTYNFKPGFYFRGNPNMVNYYGNGQYLGLHAAITAAEVNAL